MLQEISGKEVYIVDFDTMPEMPITGLTDNEVQERQTVSALMGYEKAQEFMKTRMTYAQALTDAIGIGLIAEPGKYGISINHLTRLYEVFKIVE